MKIIIRWIIVSIAVFLTTWLLPGIQIEDSNAVFTVIVVSVILGLMNAIIRPILAFLSCGCIVATLGLFMLVINAFILWGTSWIAQALGIGFYIDGFLPALLGSIIISIISYLLSMFFLDDRDK